MKRQKNQEILKDSEAPKSLKTSSQGRRGVKKRHCKHFVKFYSFLYAEEKQEESKNNAMTMMLSEKVTTLWKNKKTIREREMKLKAEKTCAGTFLNSSLKNYTETVGTLG